MHDQPAFLAAIRENPDDDTPRLVYADWLQDQERAVECRACAGRGEWQCFSRDKRARATPGYSCPACGGTGSVSNGMESRADGIRIQVWAPNSHYLWLSPARHLPSSLLHMICRRGFAEVWRGDWGDWLEWNETVCSPPEDEAMRDVVLRKVELTTEPEWSFAHNDYDPTGETRAMYCIGPNAIPGHEAHVYGYDELPRDYTDDDEHRLVLRRVFPGHCRYADPATGEERFHPIEWVLPGEE